jgi:hypothetical protein
VSPGPASETKPEADDARSKYERVMEKAAQPGWFVTYVLILILIVASWRWPRYVVDPISVGGRLHDGVAAAITAILFLSYSTLTILAYCLVFAGPSETNKKFLAAVLNRAGIGATLGALLGVRLAPALLGPGSGTGVTFPGYLGDLGNAVTLLTLVLISTVWPYSPGPLMRAVDGAFGRDSAVPVRLRKLIVWAVVTGANLPGVLLAWAVYAGLARR